ncbi:hypothetical protein [Methylobacterium aerolatum]|uniref:Uncharacterized protein n=1 Tax=Methylobacterium aerolatum TaxID=418708 RepID=A0ABU0I2A4_9HYPH|nr:hypothetical protein [Methylobacterium aerolatum]MDQ0448242.1 hypothetical protein [Methylobacterium aerolatum]GJD35755.1 hypothetical protein FMGBMHLM_2667 [Methylobacterium aerolatum]
MRIEERALLQERVKTLVLEHALAATLARFTALRDPAGQDVGDDLSRLEDLLLGAARDLADRATQQKLSVLVAVEDVSTTLKTMFDAARLRLTCADAEPQVA